MKDLNIDFDFLVKRPISYNDLKMFKKSLRHYLSNLTAKKKLPKLRSALNEFKLCFDSKGFNSGYEYRIRGGVHELTLPAWALKSLKRHE